MAVHAGIPQDDETSVNSADALCELLGIQSLEVNLNVDPTHPDVERLPCHSQSLDDLVQVDEAYIARILADNKSQNVFAETSVCVFPSDLNVPAEIMRRLTDELVWGGDKIKVDRTNETIQIYKNGTIHKRSVLTRLEHITNHAGWNQLCNGYIRTCLSRLMGQEMVLFKTKLNLKPAGGSGFAPHVDTPSLRMALGADGPSTFVTVMVAIDTMTSSNGCLSVVEGTWSQDKACPTIAPDTNASPDAGGRAGAIPDDVVDTLDFCDVPCVGGGMVAFNGWTPHRSACNSSNFARRAVFLTYNPASEGDCHDAYYQRMAEWRTTWRLKRTTGAPSTTVDLDPLEWSALATIPR